MPALAPPGKLCARCTSPRRAAVLLDPPACMEHMAAGLRDDLIREWECGDLIYMVRSPHTLRLVAEYARARDGAA